MYFSTTFFTAFHVNECFGFEISLEETVHSWKLISYSLLAANGLLSSLNANCTVATGDTNITAILNLVICPPNTVKFLFLFLVEGKLAKDGAPLKAVVHRIFK